MRVKFVQAIAGPHWDYRPGEVREIPDPVALGYLNSGVAVAAEPEPDAVAVRDDGERAVRPRPRRV